MKQSCNIIKDLLILYEDDACSEDSKILVEEHLGECSECSKYFQMLKNTDDVIADEIKEELTKEDNKVIKKGLKKIKRRWIASLVAVFMLIPLLGLGIMGYHEEHHDGIAFSNVDDIYRCIQYLKYIEDGKFEKAAEMVDFYQEGNLLEGDIPEEIASMNEKEYQAYMEERFVKKLQEYDALGIYIDNITLDSAYRVESHYPWTICVAFDENYPDGSKQRMIMHFNGETMYVGALSQPHIGNFNMDNYIDEILHLYSLDDPLNYKEMEVTFELKEGQKAIITWSEEMEEELDLLSTGVFNITFGTGTPIIIGEPYTQDSFMTSVPGSYSICGVNSERESVYFTAEDIDIQIVDYD